MPLSRLMTIGSQLQRIVIPDDIALEELGLNIRKFPGAVVLTNCSGCRVTIAHWNGSVPRPQSAPLSVARSITEGDIVELDEIAYEYEISETA